MGQAPELKNKLESAYRNSQQQAANLQKINADIKESSTTSMTTTTQAQQPTIKLKTDFSNFS